MRALAYPINDHLLSAGLNSSLLDPQTSKLFTLTHSQSQADRINGEKSKEKVEIDLDTNTYEDLEAFAIAKTGEIMKRVYESLEEDNEQSIIQSIIYY